MIDTALDNVLQAVRGIGDLIDVNGGTGLLARVAAPESSSVGQSIARRGVFRRAWIRGETWVGRQGNGISRDQYSGVFFGLSLAHDLVDDAMLKRECARRLQQLLDYLVAREWLIDEDRPSLDAAAGRGFPTFWLVSGQQLAFLLIGEQVAPGRYRAELARRAPVAELVWLGTWITDMNLDSYYKFNLQHIAFYNYFRLENDRDRRRHMARAFAITQRTVGHHRNPHFDLVQTSVHPELEATLFPSIRESLRRFVKRNHRVLAPDSVDLTSVRWETFRNLNVALPGKRKPQSFVRLPTRPLDIELRKYTGCFLWQRSPFQPAVAGRGHPRAEKPGIDLVLPYWMGRYHDAFPPSPHEPR
ncbi:hypothetical protein ACFL59_13145 [Planctomycetota bacterium]